MTYRKGQTGDIFWVTVFNGAVHVTFTFERYELRSRFISALLNANNVEGEDV